MVDEHQEEVGRLHEYIQARSPPDASCLTICHLKFAPVASLQARQSSQAHQGDIVAQGAYHPVCAVCGRAPTSRLGYGAAVCARGGAVLHCSGSFVCAPSCRGASPLHHPTRERTPNSLQRSWPCGTPDARWAGHVLLVTLGGAGGRPRESVACVLPPAAACLLLVWPPQALPYGPSCPCPPSPCVHRPRVGCSGPQWTPGNCTLFLGLARYAVKYARVLAKLERCAAPCSARLAANLRLAMAITEI